MAAVLVPFAGAAVDWVGFEALLGRTADAGLVPAVNMDTGYVNLLDEATRLEVISTGRQASSAGLRSWAAPSWPTSRGPTGRPTVIVPP